MSWEKRIQTHSLGGPSAYEVYEYRKIFPCSFHLCRLTRYFPASQVISDASPRKDHLRGILPVAGSSGCELAKTAAVGLRWKGKMGGTDKVSFTGGPPGGESCTQDVQMSTFPILWMENS